MTEVEKREEIRAIITPEVLRRELGYYGIGPRELADFLGISVERAVRIISGDELPYFRSELLGIARLTMRPPAFFYLNRHPGMPMPPDRRVGIPPGKLSPLLRYTVWKVPTLPEEYAEELPFLYWTKSSVCRTPDDPVSAAAFLEPILTEARGILPEDDRFFPRYLAVNLRANGLPVFISDESVPSDLRLGSVTFCREYGPAAAVFSISDCGMSGEEETRYLIFGILHAAIHLLIGSEGICPPYGIPGGPDPSSAIGHEREINRAVGKVMNSLSGKE